MVKYKTIIPFITGLLLIIIFIHFVGYNEFISLLKNSDPTYLFIAVVFQFLHLFFEAYKWKILLESLKENVSIKNVFVATMVGIFFNNITPSAKTGGEPMKAYLISHEEKISPVESVFATVTADRFVEALPFFVLAISSILYINIFYNVGWAITSILSFVVIIYILLLLIATYICFNKKAGEKFVFKILSFVGRFSDRIAKYENLALSMVENFHSQFQSILKNRKTLFKSIGASIFVWTFWILRTYFVFLALGISLNPLLVALVSTVTLLVGLLPLLPGGLGIIEVTMTVLYSYLRVGTNVALTVTILDRIISFWLVIIIGGIIASYNLPKLRPMMSQAKLRMINHNKKNGSNKQVNI